VSQLTPGDRAPHLVLPAADGSTVSLADLLAADGGRSVVVYFYPAAMTAGCTTQACDFRDSLASLRGAGYEVLGVSPDPVDVLREFAERDAVPYPLLSDPDRSTMTAWGAWGEKTLYGKPVTGVIRSTVVVGPDGVVTWARYGVKATGHVAMLRRELAVDA